MIVKILSSASNDFHGVKYNDKKMESGAGELMTMENFPDGFEEKPNQETVRNYLKSISKSEKVKKPQFHATISTKFQNHSKEELTEIGKNFMQEMGYGKQPYIIVFHNDTENNHIHIVSTRVDKSTGKKINDSFEKLKSQKALQKVLTQLHGECLNKNLEKLFQYQYSTMKQLALLLERNGFKMVQNKTDDTSFDILKNGVKQKTLKANHIVFHSKSDSRRVKQIKAFLEKYKSVYSNKVFKVIDNREAEGKAEEKIERNIVPKIEFESELQYKMREMFGIDIVFHHKEGQNPFGYTLIDHKTQKVYKGSQIMKMNEIFDFTQEQLEKRLFEQMKDYNIFNTQQKQTLLHFFNHYLTSEKIQDFMIFESKHKKSLEEYKKVREETFQTIKNPKQRTSISIFKGEDGNHYVIHQQYHHIHELESLIGQTAYQNFINPTSQKQESSQYKQNEFTKALDEFWFEMMKNTGKGLDPAEEERKRKRKKRR
ncbi:relaxase/mobilization nuclease domain-containing protein [Riemerella anatipestifer]|uniref:relaxase/mobilization nuclease domain-containing protein n=1 Tax=Riemerella anatipestifer TaxID=34085 RepID=UPI0006994B24|nr:relaxase/mobilization nuclease domain-containing protein [Riemerella anatipestifer]MDR7693407.1 relaxase/mobilization nuclease domain-containing protein [Riemerella anatipestifer]